MNGGGGIMRSVVRNETRNIMQQQYAACTVVHDEIEAGCLVRTKKTSYRPSYLPFTGLIKRLSTSPPLSPSQGRRRTRQRRRVWRLNVPTLPPFLGRHRPAASSYRDGIRHPPPRFNNSNDNTDNAAVPAPPREKQPAAVSTTTTRPMTSSNDDNYYDDVVQRI